MTATSAGEGHLQVCSQANASSDQKLSLARLVSEPVCLFFGGFQEAVTRLCHVVRLN